MNRRVALRAAFVVFALVLAWVLFVGLPRWYATRKMATATAVASAATPQTPGSAVRKITATLYYVSEDGMNLTPAQREVPFAANVTDQARAIVEAQLAPAPPLVSAMPADTKLHDVFVTERGDAFVDLSGDVVAKHLLVVEEVTVENCACLGQQREQLSGRHQVPRIGCGI